METHNINLNIHYSASREVWDSLAILYGEMPHWAGYADGCPTWYGMGGKFIEASVEPSGLQFYAQLPAEEWEAWISIFKEKASQRLRYEIGEPEEGYEFPDYME